MTATTHRGWCNSHVDDEDGPGFCRALARQVPYQGTPGPCGHADGRPLAAIWA